MLVVVAVLVIVDTIVKGFLPVSLRVEESGTLAALEDLTAFIGPSTIPLVDEPISPFVKVSIHIRNDIVLVMLLPFSIMVIVTSVAIVLVISLGRPEPTVTLSPPPPAMFSIWLVHMSLGRLRRGSRSRSVNRWRGRSNRDDDSCA
jgi:hypothetical protein